MGSMGRVLAVLVDAETGQRGYIITGSSSYLEPYSNSKEHIDEALRQLKTLTRDDPAQQANISEVNSLVTEKLAELDLTI